MSGAAALRERLAAVGEKVEQPLEQAFPDVNPGIQPLGQRVLVQIRVPRSISDGGIYIPDEAKKTELDNTQVAKVIALAPGAFRDRKTMEVWPEGVWVKVGDYVRVGKYNGDRFTKKHNGEEVTFAIFKDMDLTALITEDPREIQAYL